MKIKRIYLIIVYFISLAIMASALVYSLPMLVFSVNLIIFISASFVINIWISLKTFKKNRIILVMSLCALFLCIVVGVISVRNELYIRNNAPMKMLIRLGRPDAIQRAINNGYDISSKDSLLGGSNILTSTFVFYKYTAIRDYFVKRNYNNLEKITYEMLKVLLENGADPNMMDEHGMAPIHYTMDLLTEENQIMILDLLIEHGAEVDLKDEYGNTPLHLAIRKYPIMIVQELIKNGANINIKNNKGKTPLDLALKYEWEEIIEILREHGGKTSEELRQEDSAGEKGIGYFKIVHSLRFTLLRQNASQRRAVYSEDN